MATKRSEELNPKQELFCREYLKDFNGKQAAIRAGYSVKSSESTASELLSYPKVQLKLHTLMSKVFNNQEESIKRVIRELELIAFSDIGDVMIWDQSEEHVNWETGETKQKKKLKLKDKDQMGDKSRLIQTVSETETMFNVQRKVQLYDKMRALELLGKYHKMFTDKVEHSNPDGSMAPRVNVYLPQKGSLKKDG